MREEDQKDDEVMTMEATKGKAFTNAIITVVVARRQHS